MKMSNRIALYFLKVMVLVELLLFVALVFFLTEARGSSYREQNRSPTYGLALAEFSAGPIYNKRDPYFLFYDTLEGVGEGSEYWTHGIALRTLMNIYCGKETCFYWDQTVVGETTNIQYREVSLGFEFGWRIKDFTLFWNHESRHHMEDTYWIPRGRAAYPLRDQYGIRWTLYAP